MTRVTHLSAEARERIESLLAEAARVDGSAAQDLEEFKAFVATVDDGPPGSSCEVCDDAPAACAECSVDLSWPDDAYCERCFEEALSE